MSCSSPTEQTTGLSSYVLFQSNRADHWSKQLCLVPVQQSRPLSNRADHWSKQLCLVPVQQSRPLV
uniref:Uncharacterized protein n=1 Tax=Timema genevievae TaxID=629358 RepID=A0A7R9JS57_TIMGE|nr:unnamed protein product [Timema genevievae]